MITVWNNFRTVPYFFKAFKASQSSPKVQACREVTSLSLEIFHSAVQKQKRDLRLRSYRSTCASTIAGCIPFLCLNRNCSLWTLVFRKSRGIYRAFPMIILNKYQQAALVMFSIVFHIKWNLKTWKWWKQRMVGSILMQDVRRITFKSPKFWETNSVPIDLSEDLYMGCTLLLCWKPPTHRVAILLKVAQEGAMTLWS